MNIHVGSTEWSAPAVQRPSMGLTAESARVLGLGKRPRQRTTLQLLLNRSGKGKLPDQGQPPVQREGNKKKSNKHANQADASNGQNGCEYELRSAVESAARHASSQFFAASEHQLHLTENELTKATRKRSGMDSARKSGWCGFCSSCEASSRTMLSLSRNRMQGMDGRLTAPLVQAK